eukprot:7104185-Prymnesium_polylepis.1
MPPPATFQIPPARPDSPTRRQVTHGTPTGGAESESGDVKRERAWGFKRSKQVNELRSAEEND